MQRKTYFYSAIIVIIFTLTLILFYWFFRSPYFLSVDEWIKRNFITYILILLLYKSIGILFPPIPGGLLTMASIPFIGWFNAYLVDLAGSIIGGMGAYFLGLRYGKSLLVRILGEELTAKISKMKIRKDREIESVMVYRLALGSTILEAVSYGAGFLKLGFRNFLIRSFVSHLVVGIPSFSLVNNIFQGTNIFLTIAITVFGIVLIFITKGRYFE